MGEPSKTPRVREPRPPSARPIASGSDDAKPATSTAASIRRTHSSRRVGDAEAGELEGQQSSLALELAMLRRARRALRENNGRLALGIVESLSERFPRGALLEERQATRVLSLCQLDRVSQALQGARDFLRNHPGSVYAERVRSSCAFRP